jgi:crotonobetainyl-CoA:carnitine CoA-transferase CaiB-like acyl-CoA transferase
LIRAQSVAEWVKCFEAAGAPVEPVLFPEEFPDHEEGTHHFVELEHEVTGRQRFVGPIVQMSRTPTAIAGPSPLLGSDGDEVLANLGGYTSDEIEVLRETDVVG